MNDSIVESRPGPLYCAVCLYVKTGTAEIAVTVKGGTAVCYDHMSFAHDSNVRNAVMLTKKQEAK